MRRIVSLVTVSALAFSLFLPSAFADKVSHYCCRLYEEIITLEGIDMVFLENFLELFY